MEVGVFLSFRLWHPCYAFGMEFIRRYKSIAAIVSLAALFIAALFLFFLRRHPSAFAGLPDHAITLLEALPADAATDTLPVESGNHLADFDILGDSSSDTPISSFSASDSTGTSDFFASSGDETSSDNIGISEFGNTPLPVILPPPPHITSSSGIFSDTESSSVFPVKADTCPFPSTPPATSSLPKRVIVNEIAWMGSPSSSLRDGVASGNAEWIELKNISNAMVPLGGWSLVDASQKIRIRVPDAIRMDRGGFLLFVRGSTTFPYAHASEIPYGGALKNSGDDLAFMDASCGVLDYIPFGGGWPAGDNDAKRTMERDADGVSWHTSVGIGGTPGGENSVSLENMRYEVTIHLAGSGGASVASDPEGIACNDGVRCAGSFPAGMNLKLRAVPASGALFGQWSGACSGTGSCALTVAGITDITANFHYPYISSSDVENASSSSIQTIIPVGTSSSTPSSSPTGTLLEHILIAAVQIAGERSSNDFVKIYNSSGDAADLGGWKLKKRSSTGAEYSLRTFPEGTSLAPGAYFTWANSADGFAASLGADASSTETISSNNSVALFDSGGMVADALAWGSGEGQFVEGNPFPENPGAGQVLRRVFSDSGGPVDTADNASDFTLQ